MIRPGVQLRRCQHPYTELANKNPGAIQSSYEHQLDYWWLYEIGSPEREPTFHLVGWRDRGRARVSSPVEAYDPAHDLVRTETGNVYILGHPGGHRKDSHLARVWRQRLHEWGLWI